MNITYPINALPRAIPLCLGVQSEYGARPISIDVSEWVGRWPDIIVSVQPVRPGEDVSYPAAGVTRSGNIVTWTPNAYDTEIPGTGSVEIIGLADGVKIIRTGAATTIATTKSSVSKTPEDPIAAWADSVIRAGEQAKSSAEEALLLAQAANKSANNANASAVQAQSSQRAAATSASQAATYRTDAVNAMKTAINSQTQAKTSEQSASASATAAYKSQTKAEAAAKRAEDAANSMGGGTVSPGDGKLKADAIICSVSGESVSISDASERDALSVVSHISAPDGVTAGVTGITLTRTGRNIFGGMALAHSIVNQAAGAVLDMDAKTVSYHANNVGGKTLFEYPFKENTQYTLYFTPAEGSSNSPNMQVFYVGETEGVRLAPTTNKTVWVYKTAVGKTVERIAGRSFSGTSILLYEQCGIFEGVLTEADFVPYEAETFTVALPETVTDGMFDWTTGVLTINQDGASRTVQLDAQPIAMRDRYNAMWSSTGQTDVRYVADTKAYVDGHGADSDAEYADNAGYAEEAGDAQTVKGRDIAAEVDTLSEEIAGEEELQFIPVVLNVSTDGYYGKDGAFVPTASNRGYASVDVSHGDKYRLSTVVGSTAIPAVVKYGADGTFIGFEKAGTGNKEQVVDYEFVIEENVLRIVVQTAYENNQPKLALEKETVVKTKSFYTKQESDERYIAKSGSAVGARYGIRWSLTDPADEGQRCFDAAGKTAVIAEGSTLGISDFDSIYPWSEIKRCNIKHNANGASIVTFEGEEGFALDGSNGDVFVRIPKFYVERYKQDGYEYRVISNAGAQVHEAFVEDGKELDEIFIAAFEGYIDADDHMRSIAGVIPTNNETPQTFLDAAKNNGANYSLYDMRCVDALWTLMAVEYGKRNSNKILGWGVADLYQAVNNGLLVLEAANGVNSIKVTKMSNTTKAFMPVGSNLTICDGTQQDIIAQRKITACVDATDGSYTTITFDGDPVDVTTTCYVGSAACDTNWCEDCPSNALTTQHTGRATWILTNGARRIRNPIRYRWVENPVGNLWHYIPDVVFHNAQMYVCHNMKGYEFFKVDGAYKPIADLMPEQTDNGNKSDVSGANYWINSLLDDQFAKYVSIGKSWDKSYTSASAFGAYYYLRTNGTYGVANGGGFDHLWRCNMLTQRAWINETQRWYLYGARMMYKHID